MHYGIRLCLACPFGLSINVVHPTLSDWAHPSDIKQPQLHGMDFLSLYGLLTPASECAYQGNLTSASLGLW